MPATGAASRLAESAAGAAVVACVAIAAGFFVGTLGRLVAVEPLFDSPSSSSGARCVRAQWRQGSGGDNNAHSRFAFYEATLFVGSPLRTARALVHVGEARADGLELVVDAARLIASSANERLETSTTLAGCVAGAGGLVVHCTDELWQADSAERDAAPRPQRMALALDRSALSIEAQLLGKDADLYVLRAGAFAALGATTLCTGPLPGGAPTPRGKTVAFDAVLDAGALFARAQNVPDSLQPCAADRDVRVLPSSSATPASFFGAAAAFGLADDQALAARDCGDAGAAVSASAWEQAVVCAAAPAGACAAANASGTNATLSYEAVSKRAVLVTADEDGAAAVAAGADEEASVYPQFSELFVTLWRLALLVFVSAAARARAEAGVGASVIVDQTLEWAACCDEGDDAAPLQAAGDAADGAKARDEREDRIEGSAVSAVLLAVRFGQLLAVAAQRLANRMGLVFALDATSLLVSLLLFGLRAAVQPPQARHKQEAFLRAQLVLGGSSWLMDTVLTMCVSATHLPLFESSASEDSVALSRVVVLALAITQALPRLACSAAACVVCASSAKFSSEFRGLNFGAAILWTVQGLLATALLGAQLLVPILHASTRGVRVPDLVAALVCAAASAAVGVFARWTFAAR